MSRVAVAPLALALGLAVAPLALGVVAPARAEAPPVARHVLPNGVRVLVRPTAGPEVVAVSLQVRAGPALETPATAGITQLLHRVMLRGAGRRDALELAETAEAIGGGLDTAVDADTAEVRGRALARHWPRLLALVADVARAPRLEPAEVERERRLLLDELQARAERPAAAAFDAFLAELYGPHPYALPPLGRRESVERLGRDALAAYHRAIYRPDRVVVAVSGRVDPAAVLRAATERFGGLTAAGAPPAEPTVTPAPRATRRVLAAPARQAQLVIGVLAPGLAEPDHAAMRVLGALLGGGMGGRLFTALRHEQGLAYAVAVLVPSRAGPGFLAASTATGAATAAVAEATLRREFERVAAEGVGEEEVARARAYLLATLTLERRTSARQASSLAHFEAVGAGWDYPERHARAVAAVTATDVQAVARRYLGQPTVVVLEPR